MKLADLIAGTGARVVRGDPATVRICDVTEDSRTVMPGSLFIARRGEKVDGRKFVGEACEQGASAIVSDDARVCEGGVCERGAHHRDIGRDVALIVTSDVARTSAQVAERFYGSPSSALRMVGVTGTNGKTTIVHLIHQIMNASGVRCGMIGTVLIDDGREIAPASMTTPPAVEVSRTLATMVEMGCSACAMEASSHALDQGRVAAVQFAVGVFTNLTGDHLDYHKSMDAYGDAKARMFESLNAGGTAIVNAEDGACDRMVRGCRARVLRCVARALADAEKHTGPTVPAYCGVRILDRSIDGTRAAFEGPWGRFEATYALIGDHNAMNVLQAVASCHALGRSGEQIAVALAHATAPRGRLERVPALGGPTVLVDYAHTDDGLRKALGAVRSVMTSGKLWVVFGAGGEKDTVKRPRMGCAAAELADRVVVTSDNPRRERPSDIIDQILAGMDPATRTERAVVMADRREAIEYAVREAAASDVVLIAGKGHETEQVLPDGLGGTRRIEFDDLRVAREALAALAVLEPGA